MPRYLHIVKTDFKNIFRDPSLFMIVLAPLLIMVLLRFGWPLLTHAFPLMEEYRLMVLSGFCLIAAAMPGMAVGFVILDEKDENLLMPLHVLPLSFSNIILLRMGVIVAFGFVSGCLMILASGMAPDLNWEIPIMAITAAGIAPISALIPAFAAKNKIEGMTWAKLLNFLMVLPLPAFFIPPVWEWAFYLIPTFWIYKAFITSGDAPMLLFFSLVAVAYQLFLMVLTFSWIRRAALR
jgi:fluoroquinolone transport system permease protein